MRPVASHSEVPEEVEPPLLVTGIAPKTAKSLQNLQLPALARKAKPMGEDALRQESIVLLCQILQGSEVTSLQSAFHPTNL
jgi:hypothetical protein